MSLHAGIQKIFLWWNSAWQRLPVFSLVGLGSASFIGALFCLSRAVSQSPPHVYLPLDDAWQQTWQEQVLQASQPAQTASVSVQVSGAVEKPGVFSLSAQSRVQDAVLQAGGFHLQADQAYLHKVLNLASKLSDQQKIYIPFQGELLEETVAETEGSETVVTGTLTLNTAKSSDFQTISGIGEVRAAGIVLGQPYLSQEDFKERSGLSENLAKAVLDKYPL